MSDRLRRQDLLRGIWKENPVLVQMLGMCPTLAVTNTVANGLAMGARDLFVLVRVERARLAGASGTSRTRSASRPTS